MGVAPWLSGTHAFVPGELSLTALFSDRPRYQRLKEQTEFEFEFEFVLKYGN